MVFSGLMDASFGCSTVYQTVFFLEVSFRGISIIVFVDDKQGRYIFCKST